MDIIVSGKGMSIGDSLKQYTVDEIDRVVNKYFQRSIDANVVISKNSHLFNANIHILIGTGTNITIKSEADATSPYVAFDDALAKVSKQLRRYKKRLQDHNAASSSDIADTINATEYVFTQQHEAESETHEEVPVVVAESNRQVETMKVSTAIMRMDLEHAPIYMFLNEKSGHLNVIYKRDDGNIGWIDPELCHQSGKKNTKAA